MIYIDLLTLRNAVTEQAGLGGGPAHAPEIQHGGGLHRQLPPGSGQRDGRHPGDTHPYPPHPQLSLPHLGHHCERLLMLPVLDDYH